MPKESIQHNYNLPVPWGWEKMQTYRNEKLSPSPLTAYSADRLTAIGLVWIMAGIRKYLTSFVRPFEPDSKQLVGMRAGFSGLANFIRLPVLVLDTSCGG